MSILSFHTIGALHKARFPNAFKPVGGEIASLQAQGGEVAEISAAAVVGYNANPGKLVWVKAKQTFTVALGQHVLTGDYAELPEGVAKSLQAESRATIVEYAEVEAASKSTTSKAKS